MALLLSYFLPMNHMTTILTNMADIYLDLYCIAHDLQRPLTPEQVREARQTHHDMMARREINTLMEKERTSPEADFGELCLMKKLVTTFVETYVGEPEADWPVPISKKTARFLPGSRRPR